jgi:coenzyme PQQ synthesis protein D (PqqD)
VSGVELDQRLRLRPDAVIWREVDDQVIALVLERSEYVAPNESARELWRMLGEGSTQRRLADALSERWNVPAGQALRDVGAFVAELQERGLLERLG